jgi:hypothetical protein
MVKQVAGFRVEAFVGKRCHYVDRLSWAKRSSGTLLKGSSAKRPAEIRIEEKSALEGFNATF